MNRKTSTALALACSFSLIAQSQSLGPLNQPTPFWNDPAFVNAFLGSYGVHTEREPTISRQEAELLSRLVDSIKTNLPAAIQSLNTLITPQSSAALPFTLANLQLQYARQTASPTAQTNHIQSATSNYQAALARFPGFLRAHKNLGLAYAEQGRLQDAIASLSRTLELGGEDGNTYGVLGYCYFHQAKPLSAKIAYSKALLFNPDNINWKLGYAECLRQLGQHSDAAGLFAELLQDDPENASYWIFQADSYHQLGQDNRAAENYEIVRRLGKAAPEALNLLGDIYANRNLLDLASSAYLEAFNRNPDQDLTRPLRSVQILINFDHHHHAEILLNRIRHEAESRLSTDQKLQALRLAAQIHLATDRSATAITTLEEIIAAQPLDGESLLLLGDYYARRPAPKPDQRRDDVARASLYYDRAERIPASSQRALIQHAQLLVAEHQYTEALPKLRLAQQLEYRETVARYLDQVERLARRR